jgi:hypothetical protein
MATVFWDADAFIHMDFFEPGTTINLECCSGTVKTLETMIKKGSEAQEEHFAAT